MFSRPGLCRHEGQRTAHSPMMENFVCLISRPFPKKFFKNKMQRCTSWHWTLLLVAGFKFQEGKFWDRSCYNFPLPSCLRTRNEGPRDVSLLTTAISRLSLQAIMLPPPPLTFLAGAGEIESVACCTRCQKSRLLMSSLYVQGAMTRAVRRILCCPATRWRWVRSFLLTTI